ncbi:MAG: hypothetical protein V4736_15085 [Bdellovibrionota bacterium]
MKKIILSVTILIGTNSPQYLWADSTCSVKCGLESQFGNAYVIKTIAMAPLNLNHQQQEDFAAYCRSMGGAYSYAANCNPAACWKPESLSGTGSATGSTVYEARQSARANCLSTLPPPSNTCAVGSYYYAPSNVRFSEFTCN